MKLIRYSYLGLIALFISASAYAQPSHITISEFNAYDNLNEISELTLQMHPLIGVEVSFTAVIVSNPKSSGLAGAFDSNEDGDNDSIGRIHVFVTDTSATQLGRDGMSIQIVESEFALMEGFERGDVVDFIGSLGFFQATAQIDISSANLIGNVNESFNEHAHLLDPWEVELSELNVVYPDGTHEINVNFYSKYNAAYVIVKDEIVTNSTLSTRPDFSVESANGRVNLFDTSLRFRNDRTDNYLPEYNYRRTEEGDFEPPVIGSKVNLSGFAQIHNDDPFGNLAAGRLAFSINPFEDGVLWDGDTKLVDGQDIGDGEIFEWPNDLEILSVPNGDEVTVTFNVNMSTLPDTLQEYHTVQLRGGVFGNDVANTGLSNFITWDSNTLNMSNIGGDYWTISFDMSPGDSLDYKFWAGVDEINPMYNGGEDGWESGGNNFFKLPQDAVSDTTLPLQWFETRDAPFDLDPDSISVMFRVNVGPMAKLNEFEPTTDIVGVRGTPPFFDNETDWSTSELVLTEENDHNGDNLFYSGIIKFHPDDRALFNEDGQETRYKFVIENDTSGVTWESIDDRILTIPQSDTTIQWVFFSNESFGNEDPGLPVPTPPYEFGEIINYNGSFAANDLGPVAGDVQAWFFETFNGPSTYEIVDDSQDGDGKAAKATIEFDGTEDIWRAQMVNNPIYPAEGDLYNVSFWMKSSEEGSVAEAFLGLPGEGNFDEVSTHFYELSTDWSYYEFQYFASNVDEDLSLRFGVKLNFGQNDGDMIYLDNVQMEKIEAVFTPVEFSVNVAVQEDLGNFDKNAQFVGLVGSFNGWDTNAPIMMEAEFGDSIYSGSVDLLNVAVDDEIRYKFITKDDSTGIFQWESPDPENPDTDGEFSDRIAFVDDVAGMVIPTVYFHDIDRADLNADNYGITSVIDARMSPFGSHLAIQGIVTRVTNNFVYVQDGTAGTNLFSRPFFSDINSLGFNDATKTGEIVKGDEVKIAGITGDFNGLHQLVNIHAWEVVSTGNPLPDAQLVDIEEYSTNGEEYESEIVRVERVRILDQVDSLKGGFIYEIVNEAETQVGWMSIQGSFNSDWAFQPAPQGFFNIEAVVKEFFIPSLDENIYAVSIHDESDIEIIPDNFDAELSMISFAALPNTFETLNIDLIELGDEPIQGMEFTINFDPELVDVNLGDQSNTLLEGMSIVTNKLDGQLLVAFATDGTPENDITESGILFNMAIDLLATGETEIVVSDISINELPSPDLYSFVNIVPRLCGDVTGDETVSAEDATLVLQHTVKLEGIFPLVELDSTAADVTGNGDISSFDASWILQKTVGLRDNLGCITLPLKEDQQPVVANWMLTETDVAQSVIELDLSKNDFDIYSVQMELDISAGSAFKSIRNLPDSWNVITNTKADQTIIALYGVTPLEIDKLEIEMDVQNAQSVPKLKANLVLNERAAPELNELIIGDVPSEFGLNQNYPNPFNPSTNISYTLPEKADVELSIFNMLGQKVATVINQTQDAGTYTINWQAGSVSSGVYIYRLTAGGNTFTKRMMLIK
jgi:hypothetical protein